MVKLYRAVCRGSTFDFTSEENLKQSTMAYEISEQKKIGVGLVGFGILFSFLGMILFFDRGLLALGNIFWLAGVGLLLGWRSTLQLFTNRMNYKGSVSFLVGIFLIFVRWPIVGIVMELYGCILLFGGFWPSVKVFLYQIPVLGWLLQYPSLILNHLGRSSG
ncbi:OLC1v1008465C1 [Oldenlandia corymbosa var. corymbosa]|uniref:OLC1v1008465C1 n=1 Tax=Oldenlandia corymbosa var. corymbosa TaxID=529605 RepID=A0AAV1DN67_OLDCO|nr:OLC1v1008465C1 [Oldenlandia corymbosa var. corymbosa]